MTYADYCLQFRQINYYSREKTPGFERHHLTPRAVQIEKYGRVIDDTCILVTRKQHIEAHYLFAIENPRCYSQIQALWILIGGSCKELCEVDIIECLQTLENYRYPKSRNERVSKALKGRTLSEEHKQKIRESLKRKYASEKSPNLGKPLSEEHKQKISKALRGRAKSKEWRRKLSESQKGRPSTSKGQKRSEITRLRMSESHKGKPHPNTEEWRQKISKSMKGRTYREEWKEKIHQSNQILSAEYKIYKNEGGVLTWNQWRHEKATSRDKK